MEGEAGLVCQLLLVEESPQQRLSDGQARVAPEMISGGTRATRSKVPPLIDDLGEGRGDRKCSTA